jgi:putative flippase GtrA
MRNQERGLWIFVSRLAKAVFSVNRPENLPSQFVRFTFTGASTAGLDFLLLVLLVEGFSLHYLLAGGVSFVVAVTLNYLISRVWVFKGGQYSRPIEFLGFFATSGIGLGLNQLILWVFVGNLLLDYKISKVISIIIVTVWNYLTKKYLVFRDWL